jgi:hypothetical protein
MLMRSCVSRAHTFDRADVDRGVMAGRCLNGYNAPIDDGLEGRRLGCRGIAFYIVELHRALAGAQVDVGPKSLTRWGRKSTHQSCHLIAYLTSCTQISAFRGCYRCSPPSQQDAGNDSA